MLKALSRLARAFVGLWSELRRIRLLLEWLYCSGLTATGTIAEGGRFSITIPAIYLPPTAKEISDAEKEKEEFGELEPEEDRAVATALEIMKKRAKGETIKDGDPDWDLFE